MRLQLRCCSEEMHGARSMTELLVKKFTCKLHYNKGKHGHGRWTGPRAEHLCVNFPSTSAGLDCRHALERSTRMCHHIPSGKLLLLEEICTTSHCEQSYEANHEARGGPSFEDRHMSWTTELSNEDRRRGAEGEKDTNHARQVK